HKLSDCNFPSENLASAKPINKTHCQPIRSSAQRICPVDEAQADLMFQYFAKKALHARCIPRLSSESLDLSYCPYAFLQTRRGLCVGLLYFPGCLSDRPR